MSSCTGSNSQQPPPAYSEVVGEPATPIDLPPEKQLLAEDLLEDEPGLVATNSHAPPPFSVTPGTLIISPQSILIHTPAVSGARALYQVLKPLNGHAMSNCLLDVPPNRRLRDDGTLKTVRQRDELYKMYRPRSSVLEHTRELVVSGQHSDQFSGVWLRKGVLSLGITGVKTGFEATSRDEEGHVRSLYVARPNKGVFERHDGGGTLVAVDTPATDRKMEEERLEIMTHLDKRHLDLIVALWVARIYQDTQEEGAKEDKEDAKQRRVEQRELDKQEGRPYGLLHDVKEALGIGYGVKPAWTGREFSRTKENGRIRWV
ncbi:hypothetical protein N0V82_004315 [Gnomoniopsis sp. IMI 355080]|nr:hypothetical protein N0V82_004315 [Gnomoniopsis sp. IMI 355080]